jgi:hypothetical protein
MLVVYWYQSWQIWAVVVTIDCISKLTTRETLKYTVMAKIILSITLDARRTCGLTDLESPRPLYIQT